MRRTTAVIPILLFLIAALALVGWVIVSFTSLHDRLARTSETLATGLTAALIVVAVAAIGASARLVWKLGGGARPAISRAPADVIKAAEVQTESAGQLIEQVRETTAKAKLDSELTELRLDRDRNEFRVVVFGASSAGKTSLVNAVVGDEVGKVEAVMGTTKKGERHSRVIEGIEGVLILTDTPGLFESGIGGEAREAEARDLAARADLILFVLDHDLTRSECEPLQALLRQGKRSIVALNKQDRLPEPDREAILAKLRERLNGLVDPRDIVAVAAAPRAMPTRLRNPDGSFETVYEPQAPDIDALLDRVSAIVAREGPSLRAANLLLRAHLLTKGAKEAIAKDRLAKAREVVEKFQWMTAGTVFLNPLPALDLLATGAVQFQMISEIAGAYGVDLAPGHAKVVGTQMIQMLLKLGMVEAATSLVAGVFKSTVVGHAAGGAIQAVSMAYLTHVSGHAFIEYFRQGQEWGDGGLQAALIKRFDLNSRAEFLKEFAGQALKKLSQRGGAKAESAEAVATTSRRATS